MKSSVMTGKERIQAVLNGQPCDRTPVTPIFMAWAAHYIGASYRDFYLDGDILVNSQYAVTKAFNLDQISVISDPWREASDYGLEFDYPNENSVGKPKGYLINSREDIKKLKIDLEHSPRMKQRIYSVQKMRHLVSDECSVLGWVEGPIAEYADLRGLENALLDLTIDPQLFVETAQILTETAIDFAVAQIRAGADMVAAGDAAASLIGPKLYKEYVLPFEKKLFDAIHNEGAFAKLHICGNISNMLEEMAKSGADVIDVDWMVSLAEARKIVGPDIILCGNIDPSAVILQGTPQDVANAAQRCILDAGSRFFLMPGCEIPQHTPEENIRAFCPCQGSLLFS